MLEPVCCEVAYVKRTAAVVRVPWNPDVRGVENLLVCLLVLGSGGSLRLVHSLVNRFLLRAYLLGEITRIA